MAMIMEYINEKLYLTVFYQLLSKLKQLGSITLNEIDYDNIEINFNPNLESNFDSDFTIAFQKQNGSFTLITKSNLSNVSIEKISSFISNQLQLASLASYYFTDMPEYFVTHWCYDDSKIFLNKTILKNFEQSDQIRNLVYTSTISNKTSQNQKKK